MLRVQKLLVGVSNTHLGTKRYFHHLCSSNRLFSGTDLSTSWYGHWTQSHVEWMAIVMLGPYKVGIYSVFDSGTICLFHYSYACSA